MRIVFDEGDDKVMKDKFDASELMSQIHILRVLSSISSSPRSSALPHDKRTRTSAKK